LLASALVGKEPVCFAVFVVCPKAPAGASDSAIAKIETIYLMFMVASLRYVCSGLKSQERGDA
jgi:hypothetical protein